jgi:hypothetical protein
MASFRDVYNKALFRTTSTLVPHFFLRQGQRRVVVDPLVVSSDTDCGGIDGDGGVSSPCYCCCCEPCDPNE